jgi:hypothetical protein
MRFTAALIVLILILGIAVVAQNEPKGAPASATVPLTLDQGRTVIDVDLLLHGGSTERVRGWVDNGTPDLTMNRRVANLLGLHVSCDGQICSATLPVKGAAIEVAIGGMRISLSPAGETARAIRVAASTAAIAPGMSAEINIPSSILRDYDLFFNFPEREFTIGLPGHVKFNGVKSKMEFDADGLIRIPSRIENKNYDLGLDLGSSVNFLSEELFEKLSSAHPEWPHMTGAVGPFNTGGQAGAQDSDLKLRVMRVDRVQFGPLFLTDVAVAKNPPDIASIARGQRPGFSGVGVLGSEALMNYRVGLDYANSAVYFDIGRTVRFPDFDVVGLILRPEGDTGFIIVGLADFNGNASVASGQIGIQAGDQLVAVEDNPVSELTLGQVWSLLEGSPGQERKLTLSRAGKQYTVVAKVQHFLGEVPPNDEAKRKSKRN